MSTAAEPGERWLLSVLPVWLLAVVGVVLALFAPAADRINWLATVSIGGVLLSFLAQLATRRPAGFVRRARLSISGVLLLGSLGGLIALLAR